MTNFILPLKLHVTISTNIRIRSSVINCWCCTARMYESMSTI